MRQRIARRARDEGREYQPPSERDLEDLAGLSVEDILSRGRQRARARLAEETQTLGSEAD